MAFTVTARHTGSSGITGVQSLPTNSVSPTASSLLLVFADIERNQHQIDEVWQTPTGGGWTYTLVLEAASYVWNGTPDFNVTCALWRAPVGASPATHTITVDAYSGTNTAFYSAIACDITGHNTVTPVVQSAEAGATKGGGDAESGTVTLAATPAIGNLVVACFMAGNDVAGAFTAPTIGGQAMTQLHNLTGNYAHAGMWYRVIDGAETNAIITCSDLGQSVGAYSAIAVEIALASSGISHTQTPIDNLGLTDTAAVDEIEGITDPLSLTDVATGDETKGVSGQNLGLTDVIAVDETRGVADSVGMTDAVTASPAIGREFTDGLGLTDAAAIAQDEGVTDALGMTDTAAVDLSNLLGTQLTPANTLGLTDAAAIAQDEGVTDALGMTDQVVLDREITVTDNPGLTDTAALERHQRASDGLGMADDFTASLGLVRAATDALSLSDTASVEPLAIRDATDTLGLTDAVALILTRDLGDALSLSDAAELVGVFVRVLADNAGLTDSVIVDAEGAFTPRPTGAFTPQPTGAFTPRPTGAFTPRP